MLRDAVRATSSLDSSVSPALYRFDTYVARVGQLSLRGNASTRDGRVTLSINARGQRDCRFRLRATALGEPSPLWRTATFITEHVAEGAVEIAEIHDLTSPLRAASVRAGDPHAVNE